MAHVLITGGAGFIGAHLAGRLLADGDEVRVLDSLLPQVHGEGNVRPDYLPDEAELVVGDVRDAECVRKSLNGIDRVVHLTARVGVGQSMYEIVDYTSVNAVGTGVLLQELLDHPVEKLVVASSMSVYGEGAYQTVDGEAVTAVERSAARLARGQWDPVDRLGRPLQPVPTTETKQPALASVYALTKYDQERLCSIFGEAYEVPVVGLRFFNAYGTRQSLSNPYTGVLAIFASRLLNGKPPLVFEDGLQLRDFVAVADVVRACRLALERDGADGQVVNVGTGRASTVLDVADTLARQLDVPIAPQVTGRFRAGDIRHCFADVRRARELLGYEPSTELEEGVGALAEWLRGQVALDRVDDANAELAARGLAR